MIGELARQHTALAAQLAELEAELGGVMAAVDDVLDVSELAQVTDIPAADLTRWREQAATPARGKRKRTRTTTKNNNPSTPNGEAATSATAPATRPEHPAVSEATAAAPVGAAST